MLEKEIYLGATKYFIVQYVRNNRHIGKPLADMAYDLDINYKTFRLQIKRLIEDNILETEKYGDSNKIVITRVKDISEWKVKRENTVSYYH
jgi:predicted ArsR family transcriptional regulator